MNNSLDSQINRIRDLINSPRKQHALLQDSALWYMLCSCMDTIGDTEYALESFIKEDTNSSDTGRNYLLIYGALQALFVQQEAVRNLHEALKISYIEDSSLKEIRKIHRDVVGHPTKRGNKEAFNFINRGSLSVRRFQLMTTYPTEANGAKLNSEHIDIDVSSLIISQRNIFVDVLNTVIETLKEEEMTHRKKFVGKQLAETFEHTTYPFQKVFEAILSTDSPHAQLVSSHVDQILKSVEIFKAGLKERKESDDNIFDMYENISYSLQHIKTYFQNGKSTHINRKDAYIFARFAQQEVTELEAFAEELDERYSQA